MTPRRTARRVLSVFALSVPLVDCSSATPDAFVDRATPPSAAQRSRAPVPGPPASPTPPADLLRALGEADGSPRRISLGQAVDVALERNPDTQASWRRARAAAAEAGAADAAFWPTLDVDLAGSRQRQAALGGRSVFQATTWGPSASLSWTLLDLGGRRADAEESRRLLDAALFAHDATVNDLVLRVAQAYTAYEGAKALADATAASLKSAEENLRAAEERRRAGVATVADVLQSKTALSQQKLAFETARGRVETIRGALATSLGVPPNVPVETGELPETLDVDAIESSVEGVLAKAASGRPDLAEARARALAASERVRAARSALGPTLGATATAGRNYYEGSTAAVRSADVWSLGLGIRWPVFDGFSRRYDLKKAEEEARAARADAESFEQRVVLQVWTSFYALRTAAQSVRAANDLLASATETVDVTRGRYRAGVGSILDLLVAESALAQARAQHVDARAGFLLSLAQLAHDSGDVDALRRAAGRPTDSPDAPRPETP